MAYTSTCGDVKRQLGSIIKPILVYAPAINENLITQYTFVNDEKTNFSGYSPSNYNDKYYGKITVSDALAKSSNVCAVKILNDLSVEKAIKYAQKTNLTFTTNDKNLSIALGSSENGEKLSTITACYNIFNNIGVYTMPSCIKNITNKNSKFYTNNNKKNTKIINSDTVEIMNEMLKNTVKNGTAKKLNNLNFDLYAKTGTVGNKNGNTDAYSVSYNADYTLGVWFGNKPYTHLDNNISGGTIPTSIACEIWREIYKDKNCPQLICKSSNLQSVKLDKISYEQDGKLILSDDNAPERYVFNAKLKSNLIPKNKSNRFTNPKIDKYNISSINNYGIKIELCHAEYVNALVYRMSDGKKELILDTKNNDLTYIDKNIFKGKTYQYLIVPYFEKNGKIFYGKEILSHKIKSPNIEFGDDWWNNDFNYNLN